MPQVTESTSSLASFEYWLMEGFWNQNGDPRVKSLPFMGSFRSGIAILACYLIFVLVLGPRWMKHRKPFGLKKTLLVYNVTMAAFNFYFFARMTINYNETFPRMFNTKFPSLTETSDWTKEMIFFNLTYVLSKYVDLLDTVFFVLRKKDSQVTTLHLYHHFTVAFFAWVTMRLQGMCNIAAPFAYMNSFIHTVMYSYYFLAAMGPAVQKYLWWKKYLTQLQICQFIVLGLHSIYFVTTQQGYSAYYKYNYGLQTCIYLVLFSRFYFRTYNDNKQRKQISIGSGNGATTTTKELKSH